MSSDQPRWGPPSVEVERALTRLIGTYSLTYTPSEECDVWRVMPRRIWLKRHVNVGRAWREAEVYEKWLKGRGLAPALIAQPTPDTLLIEEVGGRQLEGAAELNRARVGASLGEWVATLHALPIIDEDPLDLSHALPTRWRRTLDEIGDLSVFNDRGWIQQTLTRAIERLKGAALSAPDDFSRVPCHRDLRLTHCRFFDPPTSHSDDEELTVRVIDFGQSRLDWWANDWVKLMGEGPLVDHALARYLELTPRVEARAWLSVARAHYLLGTWVWARRRGEGVMMEGACAQLRVLMEEA
jgi:hypothetical protein